MTSDLVCPAGHADRLDRSLALLISDLSRGAARRLIAAGSVFVDGRRCQVASRVVRGGMRLRVEHVEPVTIDIPLRVLHLDEDVVAIDKPAGMASEPTHQTAAGTALTLLRQQLHVGGGARPPLFSVHRLDTPTSGVLLFARTPAAAASLARQWQEDRVAKTYRCLVDGVPGDDSGLIDVPLLFAAGRARVDATGKAALTAWRVLERRADGVLLEVTPRTGRTHQIRAHLAHLGMPIRGDRKYGGHPSERLWLHATTLVCLHPRTNLPLALVASPPVELCRPNEYESLPPSESNP